jgi:hypothetical protein
MTTRLNNIRANIQNVKFAVAVGHGAHASSLPPVLIPPNMYVVFLTKPGYLGSLRNTISQGWKSVFSHQNKMRNFIKGTLPRNEIPTLVTKLGLDWKKHIYGPGMIIPNHILEMKDAVYPQFDSMTGLWLPSSPTRRIFYNQTVNLQQLVATTRFSESGKVILFISGCRSDVTITQQALHAARSLNANGYHRLVGRQNYNVPLTNYLRAIQSFEQHTSRYMTLKRHSENTGRRVRSKTVGAASSGNNNGSTNGNNGRNWNAIMANARAAGAGNNINIKPYFRMINRIKMNTFGKIVVRGVNKNFAIPAARRYFPKFFPRSMTSENVRRWVNSIKSSNNSLTNNINALHRAVNSGSVPVENNWRTNRNLTKRILHRIHTIENRRRAT